MFSLSRMSVLRTCLRIQSRAGVPPGSTNALSLIRGQAGRLPYVFSHALGVAGLFLALFPVGFSACGADLRIGIIGCDTSHVVEFTEVLNNPKAKGHVPGGKVVAAFKGGSQDINSSASRVEGYTQKLQEKYGVKV